MGHHRPTRKELAEARRRLGNPYAFLEYLERDDPQALATERAGRDSQNPYASLSPWWEEGDLEERDGRRGRWSTSEIAWTSSELEGISKEEFRRSSIRIFRQYVPRLERGALRPQHRDFIDRNESRSPQLRRRLLAELQRYDLSNVVGITSQFNRELESLTVEKLRAIEKRVLDESE